MITVAILARMADSKAGPLMRAFERAGYNVTLNQPLTLSQIAAALACVAPAEPAAQGGERCLTPDFSNLPCVEEHCDRASRCFRVHNDTYAAPQPSPGAQGSEAVNDDDISMLTRCIEMLGRVERREGVIEERPGHLLSKTKPRAMTIKDAVAIAGPVAHQLRALRDKLNEGSHLAPACGLSEEQERVARTLDSIPTNWELSWGNDDEEEPCEWRVWRCIASPNDREWDLIGRGATPSAALAAARLTHPDATKETK